MFAVEQNLIDMPQINFSPRQTNITGNITKLNLYKSQITNGSPDQSRYVLHKITLRQIEKKHTHYIANIAGDEYLQ